MKLNISKTATVLAMLGVGAISGFGAATGGSANGNSNSGSGSTTFTGTLTVNKTQSSDYFVYTANNGALSGAVSADPKGLGFIPAGGPYPVNETVNQYISSGTATLLGLYSPSNVVVALNQSAAASALNQGWSAVFSNPTYSEANIAAALSSGNSTTLLNFLNSYTSDFVSFTSGMTSPITATILDFSNATNGGSITFASVVATGGSNGGSNGGGNNGNGSGSGMTSTPEPASELLLGLGLSVVAFTARKFRKA